MPVLARHEGEWDGEYIWVDANGMVIDRHRAQLTCRFPQDGSFAYWQTNRYTWPDGRTEVNEFPAVYHDNQIWFDTERLAGHAWEVDNRVVILTWVYKHDPSGYFYELIHLSDDGNYRTRTWHFIQDGKCTKRTLINEVHISSTVTTPAPETSHSSKGGGA
jgi:hypothetical protein